MIEISTDQIIHKLVVERFGITSGIINKGLLDAIVKRPETEISGEKPFTNIYSKSASLLESIIRWHPFADGNKRTALLTVIYYMQQNGYGIALPLSAVRLTVKIAKNKKTDSKATKRLINEIARWLINHADQEPKNLQRKITIYLNIPYRFLIFLARIKLGKLGYWIVDRWLAFDIYPEYKKEADEIMKFMQDALLTSIRTFEEFKKDRTKNRTKISNEKL
jgi:death-on-curing protein